MSGDKTDCDQLHCNATIDRCAACLLDEPGDAMERGWDDLHEFGMNEAFEDRE